tara:strand:+ start:66 stop:389 length:324 start_codon:yes stop_codon:yes gene_type:complete
VVMKKNMELNLGIGSGDVAKFTFENTAELLDFINEVFKSYDNKVVWLYCYGGENGEIIVTENSGLIFMLVCEGIAFSDTIHIHEYPSYEDAYKVALDMREENPKCYN